MRINRGQEANKRSTVAVIAAAAAAMVAYAASGAETCHDAALANAPSATGIPWIDFFTGGGYYMPRTHGQSLLPSASGRMIATPSSCSSPASSSSARSAATACRC